MRERTPSADDTPKRAPPAPPGEADVAVRKATDVANAAAYGASKMVASTHSLDDLGVSHLGSASQQTHHHNHLHHHPHNNRHYNNHHHNQHTQPTSEKHHQPYGKSAQSAQDKRSRLSNVINNLRKKVPPEAIKRECTTSTNNTTTSSSVIKEEDNTRDKGLETLEKYMMTVLNGAIEDEEKRPTAGKKEQLEQPELVAEPAETGPSKDYAKDLDGAAAAPAVLATRDGEDKPGLEPAEASDRDAAVPKLLDEPAVEDADDATAESSQPTEASKESLDNCVNDASGEKDVSETSESQGCSKEEEAPSEPPKTLGTIILDRLSEQCQDLETCKKDSTDSEARKICRDLVEKLVDDVLLASNRPSRDNEADSGLDSSTQSLHCSLPLDKVASVLPSCQTLNSSTPVSEPVSLSKPASSPATSPPVKPVASPVVRHLCLYCKRKFSSLSLRQRHTERIHQASIGRRSSVRNSRKSTQQSCQYCVNKCTDNLEGLFQHLVGSHSDKYHGCLQCSTRYQTKDALTSHIHEIHSHVTVQMEKLKEPIVRATKESMKVPSTEIAVTTVVKEESLEKNSASREQSSKSDNPEFDNTFYSTVSCNIRENLLHHLDGKLHKSEPSSKSSSSSATPTTTVSSPESKPYQLPIDISLTAVTPVYNKDYSAGPEDFGNSSEQAGKPSKSCGRGHPHRRVSFEKYNFPRKYDSKEQWSCSIKDLSRFDISTQLTLRKKQQLAEGNTGLSDLTSLPEQKNEDSGETKVISDESETVNGDGGSSDGVVVKSHDQNDSEDTDKCKSEIKSIEEATVFSSEFESFIRLKKCGTNGAERENQGLVYAELTGEWSRPRVYVCGACADRFVTLRELEDHKSMAHPNVWCMHFEFAAEQRELYKHLVFLPSAKRCPSPAFTGSSVKTRQQTTAERVCTKCTKVCASLSELHRHILECGGDQAWLLGLFGNGKKKCKWRPFGSRSRRRRQRGMKRNIQNSQTPRNYVPRERTHHSGPRVRPSDRESIQKMLANLPAKRATRKVLQENAMVRSQGRLRSAQSRGSASDNPASRIVKSKAVLRNKLLKNAKSFQRKKNLREEKEARVSGEARASQSNPQNPTPNSDPTQTSNITPAITKSTTNKGGRLLRNLRVLGKRQNVKSATLTNAPTTTTIVHRHIKLRSSRAVTRQSVDESTVTPAPEPVKKRLLPKPVKQPSPEPVELQESIRPRKRRKKGRRLIVESRLSPPSSTDLPNVSTKTKPQPRNNDGKFTTKRQRNLIKRLDTAAATTPRLFTRSKLRAAAKLAWQEHTRISRRVTRLASLDLAEKSNTSEVSLNDTAATTVTTPTTNVSTEVPELTDLIEPIVKLKRTFSRNSSTSRRSLDGGVAAVLEEKLDIGKIPSPPVSGNSRGRRPKKDVSPPNGSINAVEESSTTPTSEPISELKVTRRQRSQPSTPAISPRLEFKTRRSTANKEGVTSSVSQLPKKSSKSPETLVVTPVEEEQNSGLITRSNSRGKKEAKESVVDIIARKIAKDISERKTPNKRQVQKDITQDKKDKTMTIVAAAVLDKSTDTEIESNADDSLSLKKEKTVVSSGLRKSMRKKEIELKETIDEISKIEDTPTCKPNGIDDVKTEVTVSSSTIGSKEDNNKEKTETVAKKTPTGKRRGRVKRKVEVTEELKTSEPPPITTAITTTASEEPQTQETKELDSSKDVSIADTPVVASEETSQIDDNLLAESKDNSSNNSSSSLPTLEHLQHESSNSNMDSGKENSADAIVTATKSKLARPRKTRVLRKDGKPMSAVGKRSLSSVIGILTEAVNVPVHDEATTVLTVQTSFDIVNPSTEHLACQSSEQSSLLNSTDVGEKSAEPSASASSSVELKENLVEKEKIDAPKETSNSNMDSDKEISTAVEADNIEQPKPVEPVVDKKEEAVIATVVEKKEELAVSVVVEKKEEVAIPAVVEKKEEVVIPAIVAPVVSVQEEPPTDIILDLSRRKPKGKGSFLEKIVSKIAKQKDVSLGINNIKNHLEFLKPQRYVNEAEKVKPQECEIVKPIEVNLSNGSTTVNDEIKSSESKTSSIETSNAETSVETSHAETSVETSNAETSVETSNAETSVETKIESNEITSDVSSVKLSEAASVNSVNNNVNVVVVEETIERISNDNSVDVKLTENVLNISPEIVKSEDKEEVKNDPIENNEPEKIVDVKEVLPEDKPAPKEKKNLKKRSLETCLTRNSKKKPIDNENMDSEDRDEICLADIMKLIDRSKSKDKSEDMILETEVKPGKRKSSEDDAEVNTEVEDNTSTSADCVKEKETAKKTRRKGAQKKNKNKVSKLVLDNDVVNNLAAKHNSEVSLDESKDISIDVKLTNDSNEIADNEISAINLGPIAANVVDENKIPDSKVSDETNCSAQSIANLDLTISCDENLSADSLVVQNVINEDNKDKISNKIVKCKKRGRKKNSKVVKEIAPPIAVEEEITTESNDKSDIKSSEECPIAVDESFKVPEATEVTKSSKKRVSSRRRSNLKDLADNLLDSEKNEENTLQKQSNDDKTDLNNDNTEHTISEPEEKVADRRISKRSTRSSRNIEDTTVGVKESDDSDVSSTNDIETLGRRRSQRKHVAFVEQSRDVSTSSVDENPESSMENKVEKRQSRGRKAKKNVSLAESFSDAESRTDLELNTTTEKSTVQDPIVEKVIEDAAKIIKEPTIEETLQTEPAPTEAIIPKEVKNPVPLENDQPVQEDLKIENPPTSDKTSKDQPIVTSNSPSSSIEENLDSTDKQLSIHDEASGSENEESTDLTAKKRSLGNFSVVNKSGKILIVEKKKKLTKEVAKFFCAVCTTSFTRKSSLKKHNLSQSHVMQVTVGGDKEISKDVTINDEQIESPEKSKEESTAEKEEKKEEVKEMIEESTIEKEKIPEVLEDLTIKEPEPQPIVKSISISTEPTIEQISELIVKPIEPTKILTPIPEILLTTTPTLPELPFFAHKSPEQLEDEMLDEEICKITENMSHDEYVLTDHVSPLTPEAASTPIKKIVIPVKEIAPVIKAVKKKKEKKEKKKKNLADEHLSLDTPVPVEKNKVIIDESDKVDQKLENLMVDSVTLDEVDKVCEKVTINEADSSVELQVKNSKKNVKPKVSFEEVVDDTRRTTRNRNQINDKNLSGSFLENTRSKRNQLRPNYKEENLYFGIELSGNRSEEELATSKTSKKNVAVTEIKKSDLDSDNSVNKAKEMENTRPKRNQFRPNYKEENLYLGIELSGNRSEEEFAKSKISKKNVAFTEIEKSDLDNDVLVKKAEDTKSDKEDISVSEIEATIDEKVDVLIQKKSKARKGKKKMEKSDQTITSQVSPVPDAKENVENNEEKDSKLNVGEEEHENTKSELKEDLIEENNIFDESQKNTSAKRKRGKKQKKANGETDKTIDEKPISTENQNHTEEPILEKEETKIDELPSQKHNKSKKNQNRKSKKNDTLVEDTPKNNVTIEEAQILEDNSLKHDDKAVTKIHDIEKSKLVTLESSTMTNEPTKNVQKEVLLTSLPIDKLKHLETPIDSSKNNSEIKQHLVFPSLSNGNFKSFNEPKKDLVVPMLSGFDSDDNSLDTNMSVDIQKLLDDPEMTTEIAKQPDEDAQVTHRKIEPVDILNIKEPSLPIKPSTPIPSITTCVGDNETPLDAKTTEESKDQEDPDKSLPTCKSPAKSKKSQRSTKSTSSTKNKHRSKKSKTKSSAGGSSSASEESEPEQENVQKSKNKIVKCVFGRVFGNEKPDKVKEVLDDWQSRSENNSSDSESDIKSARKSRSRTRKGLRANESSGKTETNGRSRQSKRRAEELISKSFDKEWFENERLVKKIAKRGEDESASLDKEDLENNEQINNAEEAKLKKIKKRREESIKETEYPSDDDKFEESRESKLKVTSTSEHDNTNNEVENEEDVDRSTDGVSPRYVRNSSVETKERKGRSSTSDDEDRQPKRQRKNRKKKSKGRLSSPSNSRRVEETSNNDTKNITIGLTDALEDNALDVDAAATEGRQSTKVLNFDEELFVECCSRLKASEKELRATKKIKLDHTEEQIPPIPTGYHHHKRDEQMAGHRSTKDRWRDVESQNNLGSLLESVNQLLGEEYNSREREYNSSSSAKRSRNHHHHHHHHHHHNHHHRSGHHHNHHHHHHHHHHNRHNSTTSGHSTPEDNMSPARPADYFEPGYDDSLDVAFEHNNKLRDKIQRRMRESESLIATSFGQHTKSHGGSPAAGAEAAVAYDDPGFGLDAGKAKINNGFGGIVDKALSNLLHGNEKHDHNGSTPMKLLAELACARAPTATTPTVPDKPDKIVSPTRKDLELPTSEQNQQQTDHINDSKQNIISKKNKNPIKELFERKKEQHDKKQQLGKHDRMRKPKKSKTGQQQHTQSLIRTGQYRGGMAERKRRRDCGKKKDLDGPAESRIKDVYDFDDDESAGEANFNAVLSYRAKTESAGKEFSMSALLSKAIGDVLTNGKSVSAMTENLENMIDRKFKDIENYEAETAKAKNEDKQENIVGKTLGPMDDYVERKQKSSKRTSDQAASKHSSKSKKKTGKPVKKKSRNAWYENDSSDEFVTKLKTDDLAGVGINKSQRTCSKGKQNLFAEMSSTSSESEFERDVDDVEEGDDRKEAKRQVVTKETLTDKSVNETTKRQTKDKKSTDKDESQNDESQEDWPSQENNIETKSNLSPYRSSDNNKKSESELSDHPLVIDENQKESADIEQRTNSDDETEDRPFELDDLYREDSSIIDSDRDELSIVTPEDKSNSKTKSVEATQEKQTNADKYISVEEALDLLDGTQEITKKTKAKTPTADSTRKINKKNIDNSQLSKDEEEKTSKIKDLPEKLSGNEKPKRESENLPLHVFLSRKVQESKKRKQQQLKKQKEEEERERILLELQPTRRQRKCAIGKQGLLAEISSSDEEPSVSQNSSGNSGSSKVAGDRSDSHERSRIGKQRQRESKEKRKERYIEKKHEQMIAKEQKAIEEAIMRELEEKRLSAASEASGSEKDEIKQNESIEGASEVDEQRTTSRSSKSKKQKQSQAETTEETAVLNESQVKRPKSASKLNTENVENGEVEAAEVAESTPVKKRKPPSKSPQKSNKKTATEVKSASSETRKPARRSAPTAAQRRSKNRTSSTSRGGGRESRDQAAKSDDELKATRSWNKVEEGVGVAIGRRKRAAANQLYYWSSSSDEEELVETSKQIINVPEKQPVGPVNGSNQDVQEDDRQEQHGWIVGDSHKRMITMLAMEKQMKEKRRRSENDEQSTGDANTTSTTVTTTTTTTVTPAAITTNNTTSGKSKANKKHRNSTS